MSDIGRLLIKPDNMSAAMLETMKDSYLYEGEVHFSVRTYPG